MLAEVGGEKTKDAYGQLRAQEAPLFEALKDLPKTSLTLPEVIEVTAAGRRGKATLSVTNGGVYARLVRMRAEWERPEDEAPFVLFSDNYIDLLPHENKSVLLDLLLPTQQLGKLSGTLMVEGPNTETRRIPIRVVAN